MNCETREWFRDKIHLAAARKAGVVQVCVSSATPVILLCSLTVLRCSYHSTLSHVLLPYNILRFAGIMRTATGRKHFSSCPGLWHNASLLFH